MPVVINPNHWQGWLAAPVDEIEALVAPYPADDMQAWQVSRRVSKPGNDDAGQVEPIKARLYG